jgi:Xaa-Pro aminopeptidase
MVFAVEPLIWVPDIPGGAGVRLEDTIAITQGAPEVLTRTGFDARLLGK